MNSVRIKLYKYSLMQFQLSKNFNNKIHQHKLISITTLIIPTLLQNSDNIFQKLEEKNIIMH